jgi:hypothetical protein
MNDKAVDDGDTMVMDGDEYDALVESLKARGHVVIVCPGCGSKGTLNPDDLERKDLPDCPWCNMPWSQKWILE